MKRFLAWLHRPHLHVHFVEPGKETNPLAERAIESLKQTLGTLQSCYRSSEQVARRSRPSPGRVGRVCRRLHGTGRAGC
jgi:hypothetical protein